MAYYEESLFLKKSQLPNAGKGLFTKTDIPKGKIIVQYKGSVHKWNDVKHTDGHNAYLFKINNNIVLNAEKYMKSFARYANDARGFSKIVGLRNNAEYLVKKNECFIISIRKIHKGEEILVPYGKKYWDLMKKIQETRDKGQGTRDKGQGTRDKGQGTRDKEQGTRDKGQGTRDKGQGTSKI